MHFSEMCKLGLYFGNLLVFIEIDLVATSLLSCFTTPHLWFFLEFMILKYFNSVKGREIFGAD